MEKRICSVLCNYDRYSGRKRSDRPFSSSHPDFLLWRPSWLCAPHFPQIGGCKPPSLAASQKARGPSLDTPPALGACSPWAVGNHRYKVWSQKSPAVHRLAPCHSNHNSTSSFLQLFRDPNANNEQHRGLMLLSSLPFHVC